MSPSPRGVDAKVRREGGFTIVELLMVITLISLLTSFAAPLLRPGRWRADSAVQEVMIGLNAAQRLAVLRQHDVIVKFVLADRRLLVHRDMDNDGAVDGGEDTRVIELPETMAFSRGTAPPIEGVADDVTFETDGTAPALVFHRNGSASESGMAYLRPVEGSMSDDPNAARAVAVERATGQVRCFTHRTGSWEASC